MHKNTWKLLLFLINVSLISALKPVVETSHGKVQGKVLKTLLHKVEYYGFMGIPFAKPPIKDLRFLPPQPIDPWEETLIATKEKPACAQFNSRVLKGASFGYYGSEDCLYLDIFTPKLDTTNRSVIVFIYNENFSDSYNKTKEYAPDFFMEEDVVIVTLSHRLTAFGFLSLDTDEVPGNAGLKDIVAALEWIKSNVANFGGDPDKITLMGAQGGAVAVDLLLHSNSKHLFQSAIMQGRTSWQTTYLQEGYVDRAFKLAELLDRPSGSISQLLMVLNELKASEIILKELQASPQDYFKENQRSLLTFGPIVEKQSNGLITQYPEDSEESINIPIMIGFNSREGLLPSLQYLMEPRYLSFVQKDFPFLMPLRIKFKFDPFQDGFYDAVEEIKKFYFKKGKVTIKSVPELATYLGDVVSGYSVNYAAMTYAKRSSSPIYYYHFDYFSDLNEMKNIILKLSTVNEGTWGAASGDELCYLFYCPDLKKQYLKHNEAMSEEITILKKIVKMWTNFAKFGNPTPEGDIHLEGLKWPKYDLDTKQYLHIDKNMTVKSDICVDRFKFWDEHLEKWEKMAVNGTINNLIHEKDEL